SIKGGWLHQAFGLTHYQQIYQTPNFGQFVTSVDIVSNGSIFIIGGQDRTARVFEWRGDNFYEQDRFGPFNDDITAVAITPDASTYVIGDQKGIVRVFTRQPDRSYQ